MGRGARGWRSVPSRSPPIRPPKASTPRHCAPHNGESQLRGGVGREGGRPFPPHPVLSGPAQGPSFPSPGPLSPKGACPAARERTGICTIPEVGLGGLGPSQDPAFVFLSKKKNYRGSDGAKSKGLPGAPRREEASASTRGRREGSAARGEGKPWKGAGRGEKAGARGVGPAGGRRGALTAGPRSARRRRARGRAGSLARCRGCGRTCRRGPPSLSRARRSEGSPRRCVRRPRRRARPPSPTSAPRDAAGLPQPTSPPQPQPGSPRSVPAGSEALSRTALWEQERKRKGRRRQKESS